MLNTTVAPRKSDPILLKLRLPIELVSDIFAPGSRQYIKSFTFTNEYIRKHVLIPHRFGAVEEICNVRYCNTMWERSNTARISRNDSEQGKNRIH
jgi:hypothetical protein